jgi:hypothetical protein
MFNQFNNNNNNNNLDYLPYLLGYKALPLGLDNKFLTQTGTSHNWILRSLFEQIKGNKMGGTVRERGDMLVII